MTVRLRVLADSGHNPIIAVGLACSGPVAAVAEAVKPDIEVQTIYLTQPPDFRGFNDPTWGRTAAQNMFDAGAGVVHHAAGGSGGGLFEAARASGNLAIGVDSDQDETPRTRSRTSS